MNENQQPSLQQEKERLLSSTRYMVYEAHEAYEAYEGKMKAESFIELMQANHLLLP